MAQIKKDGSTWVSKYARGGSARKQAARKMYIVVRAIPPTFRQLQCSFEHHVVRCTAIPDGCRCS